MKKCLITLALASTTFLFFSCDDSENDTEEMRMEIDNTPENEDSEDNEDTSEGNGSDVDNSENNENQPELVLTDCLQCPSFELTTVNGGGTSTEIVAAAEVCKGEDGKAYVSGILNEDFETYELYLQNRQMFGTRCN